jgi:hypothetical protein
MDDIHILALQNLSEVTIADHFALSLLTAELDPLLHVETIRIADCDQARLLLAKMH